VDAAKYGPYLALTDAFGRVRIGPNASDEIDQIPDAEPDLRSGPGLHSNLGPDFGSVQRPSGVRIGPGPDHATTTYTPGPITSTIPVRPHGLGSRQTRHRDYHWHLM
jgi:hypothetical protein